MDDEKIMKQYVGFQQGINLGDNYSVPAGGRVQADGSSKGFERMKQVHEMKKQAEAEGMTLAQYMAKLKTEMEEAEMVMRGMETEVKPNVMGEEAIGFSSPTSVSLGNLPEEEKKRAELEKSNTIFRTAYKGRRVDMLAIYNHIRDHFVEYIKAHHNWAAVYIYFFRFLSEDNYVAFADQMMSVEWFGYLKDEKHKACTNEALGTYSCLIQEHDRNLWSADMRGHDKDTSPRGVSAIKNLLIDLEVEGEGKTFLIPLSPKGIECEFVNL